jgi:NitT/TauT family transport system permease protein
MTNSRMTSSMSPRIEGVGANWSRRLRPVAFIAGVLSVWHVAVLRDPSGLSPSPVDVARGIWGLAWSGLLFKYIVASLFRVTWGFGLAALVAIPSGLAIGWYRRSEFALNPFIQILRPISPLAWTPIAILWFGVGDASAIFLIFMGSMLPLIVTTVHATAAVPAVYLNAGRNFGLRPFQLLSRIIYPAIAPQLIIGLRITLGVAWIVVVAAEMIAVNSGLGFLIVDARNAGNRYDLVMGGMVVIGVIGMAMDGCMRSLESASSLRWGYSGG